MKEAISKWLAYRLPERVIYWSIIRLWALLTTGKYNTLHPDQVTLSMALKHLDGTDAT